MNCDQYLLLSKVTLMFIFHTYLGHSKSLIFVAVELYSTIGSSRDVMRVSQRQLMWYSFNFEVLCIDLYYCLVTLR